MKKSITSMPIRIFLVLSVVILLLVSCILAPTAVSPSTDTPPLTLSAYVGQQITLAITNPNGPDNKPEISLFIGNLEESSGQFSIVTYNGETFVIPEERLKKVKIMDEQVKSILGGSEFLLPITKSEFEAAGFNYKIDQNGVMDIQVSP